MHPTIDKETGNWKLETGELTTTLRLLRKDAVAHAFPQSALLPQLFLLDLAAAQTAVFGCPRFEIKLQGHDAIVVQRSERRAALTQ